MGLQNKTPARCAIAAAISFALNGAHAADSTPPASSSIFTLGQITVTGSQKTDTEVDSSKLNQEQLQDFSKTALPDALNLIPGVASTAGSGTRNETLISVRGFDRWQVPLLLDGIRLYLPADNRIDFDRFLTPDLSEIQVSKNYVSVINGPDGMGGAINLVTRKPTKPLEGEIRSALALGGNGQVNGNTQYANIGGKQQKYYFQLSAEQKEVTRWRLSDDYVATPAESGGDRDHADKKDSRVNFKLGLTPNASDEYSLNFVKQEGQKHGIGAVSGTSTISTWDWPKWDTWSTYWLSHTQLDSKTYVKTKAYYNKFENDLVAYTDSTLNTKSWTSHYDDYAEGVNVEFGSDHLRDQTLKTSVYLRRDHHTEWQVTETTGFSEPKQTTTEDVFSGALEDTWHLSDKLDLVGGLSRDMRKTRETQEYASNVLFDQPTADSFATNYQSALIYHYSNTGKVHLSASDRTRFPTMFERFSSRFGGAISNPGLKPERALNLEVGGSELIIPGLRGEVAVFHNDVDDAIQSVPITYNGGSYTQYQNVGEAIYDGFELGLNSGLSPHLDAGGNYSYIHTRIKNPNDATARLTTVPQHKIFLYAKWMPKDSISVVPTLEYASPRWSGRAIGTGYTQTGEYALLGLKASYQINTFWDISLAGQNLLDKNYQVADGYPQEGRNYTMSTRVRF